MISLILFSGLASAEPVYVRAEDLPPYNIQLFSTSIDSKRTFLLTETSLQYRGFFSRVSMHMLSSPLSYTPHKTNVNNEKRSIVGNAVQSDLIAGATLGDLRIGAALPIILFEDEYSRTGFGDIRIDGKYVISNLYTSTVGLALSANFSIPTSSIGTPFSDPELTHGVTLSLDKVINKALLVHVNAGYRTQTETQYENFNWGTNATLGAGASYRLIKTTGLQLGAVGEVLARTHIEGVLDPEHTVIDCFFGTWSQIELQEDKPLNIRLGFGSSLTGTPGSASRLHIDTTYSF